MASFARQPAVLVFASVCCLLAGCANPGPPKPPSLQIPAIVSDLSARRLGDAVTLEFTLPQRSTDGMPLRSGALTARLCRAVDTGTCVPVAAVTSPTFPVAFGAKTPANLRDALAPSLTTGAPHLLTYRVELFRQGSSTTAGFSAAAYAAAGAAPPSVTELQAQGSRLGVVLRWQPASPAAEVLLRREDLNPRPVDQQVKPKKPAAAADKGKLSFGKLNQPKVLPAIVTLNAAGDTELSSPGNTALSATLDATATAETSYRYTAERLLNVELDGHKLQMWSDPSAPIVFTWHDMYPPPAPTSLSVVGFVDPNATKNRAAFAVDLIWDPVPDEQLAGYKVYRQLISGNPSTEKVLLTPTPVNMPAFHDTTASGSRRYRYSVVSIDLRGNESTAATAVLEPQAP